MLESQREVVLVVVCRALSALDDTSCDQLGREEGRKEEEKFRTALQWKLEIGCPGFGWSISGWQCILPPVHAACLPIL